MSPAVALLTVTFPASRGHACSEGIHPSQRKAEVESLLDISQCILSVQGSRQKLHRGMGEDTVFYGRGLYVGTWGVVQCHCALFFYVFLCETPV